MVPSEDLVDAFGWDGGCAVGLVEAHGFELFGFAVAAVVREIGRVTRLRAARGVRGGLTKRLTDRPVLPSHRDHGRGLDLRVLRGVQSGMGEIPCGRSAPGVREGY